MHLRQQSIVKDIDKAAIKYSERYLSNSEGGAIDVDDYRQSFPELLHFRHKATPSRISSRRADVMIFLTASELHMLSIFQSRVGAFTRSGRAEHRRGYIANTTATESYFRCDINYFSRININQNLHALYDDGASRRRYSYRTCI